MEAIPVIVATQIRVALNVVGGIERGTKYHRGLVMMMMKGIEEVTTKKEYIDESDQRITNVPMKELQKMCATG